MEGIDKKKNIYSSHVPLYAIMACTAVLVLTSSVLALVYPAVNQCLACTNLAILAVSVWLFILFMNRLKRNERRLYEKSVERERILHDALDSAESSAKARRAIIANMSHEFRTPLNSVIGFAELLAEGETDGNRAEMARCVQRGGWELLELVNSLVKAAELSGEDGIAPENARFTLKELTTAVGAAHEREMKAKGLRFRPRWEDEGTYIGDLESISAVLGILVSNAIKYSDSGMIELRARELSVSDGNRVTIECVVQDQGNGIDEDTMARLFRPFEQGEDPLIKRYPGVGVGLYNAKRITEKLRGDLKLESRMGVGTTAYLILPLEADKARGE